MLLLLVRHAVTAATGKHLTGWLPGHHLSPEGRRQAEALAERLAALPVKAMYSSPLERCRETAEVVAARLGLEVETMEDLGEVRYGDWQGRPLKALARTKAWAQLMARPADFRFPGGESIREAQTRGIRGTELLRERHAGKVVVAVSHADVIRLVVAGYLALGLDLYQRISIAPASVSAVLLGDRIPRVLRLADSGTFEDLAERLRRPAPETARKAGRKPGGGRKAGADGRPASRSAKAEPARGR